MASSPNLSPARIKARPGVPYPLGATYDRSGVNFVLGLGGRYSGRSLPVRRSRGRSGDSPLRGAEQTDRVWRIYLGQRYGYCVHGPYEPQTGKRFNNKKLVLDPYAKAVDRTLIWDDRLFGYQFGSTEGDLAPEKRS